MHGNLLFVWQLTLCCPCGPPLFPFFENIGFSFLKWTLFCTWNYHIFCILKVHISYVIIRKLHEKVTWKMATLEMVTFERSSSQDKGQTVKIWSEGFILSFKVSNLSWKSNIENLNIQNVKFWVGKDKQRKSEMKVPMWLCKVSYVTIY